MKIRFDVPAKYGTVLNKMAEGAQVPIDKLAEIALYNLIALYMQERGYKDDSLVPYPAYGDHYVGRVGDDDDDSKVL